MREPFEAPDHYGWIMASGADDAVIQMGGDRAPKKEDRKCAVNQKRQERARSFALIA
jgi:hypothetical protein